MYWTTVTVTEPTLLTTTTGVVHYCHSHTVCTRVHTWNMYSCLCMLSEYKTHIGLKVEGGHSSNQDHYNFLVTILTSNMKCCRPSLYKQSQCEEQNEQVNTNKHHIQDQLFILCVHQCTESGVHQLPVVSSRCSLYKQQS